MAHSFAPGPQQQPEETRGTRAELFRLWQQTRGDGSPVAAVAEIAPPADNSHLWRIDIEADSFKFWD